MKKARYSFFSRQDSHFQYDLFPFKKFYIVHVLSEESARAVKRWTSAETQDSHLVVKHVILNTYQTLTEGNSPYHEKNCKSNTRFLISGWLSLNWLIPRSTKVELSPSLVTLGPLGCLRPSCLASFELLRKAMSNENIGASNTPT